MEEDDGTAASSVVLRFKFQDDLVALADKFCKINSIEGDEAVKELVGMMRKEVR